MKYLFFDTETTGFPPKARLVQIAWQIWEDDKKIKTSNHIIYPEDFKIPLQAAQVHGITTEIAKEKGEDLREVMTEFDNDANTVDKIVAHNYNFDKQIVMNEFRNLFIFTIFDQIPVIDTMKSSTDYLKLPQRNRAGYKFPRLEELYRFLFDKDFDNAHSADADVDATVECFFELKKRGII